MRRRLGGLPDRLRFVRRRGVDCRYVSAIWIPMRNGKYTMDVKAEYTVAYRRSHVVGAASVGRYDLIHARKRNRLPMSQRRKSSSTCIGASGLVAVMVCSTFSLGLLDLGREVLLSRFLTLSFPSM